MAISVLDIFKIGIGPSSSHTVGPMIAARRFAEEIAIRSTKPPARVVVELYGSLGATGRGHGTDKAVILGLRGYFPVTVDVNAIPGIVDGVGEYRELVRSHTVSVPF